ncbi:MAG TPA: 2-dehydropantoate 2-reductase [Actinomycetota bacterium]|nr:2-dehydropantoate 2-reductase [Actinomycetota bacterium]
MTEGSGDPQGGAPVNQGPLPPARVAVLGPGGVGGLVAALLARRGDQVTCLAPPATAAHLAANGLELRSPALGDVKVAVAAASRLDHPVDVCFVTVKATQLAAAVEAVPPEVLGDGLVVPFLNGVDHVAWLRERYPPDQVVAGTIRIESTRVGPGLIEHASPFAAVELAAGKTPRGRVEELAGRLAETGLDVTVRDHEAATLWSKLAVLAPIALVTTWTAAPYGEARAGHWEELAAVLHEIVGAAAADGVELDEAAIVGLLERIPDGMRSSMQKDAVAGRPIELDAVGATILRAADRAGTDAPVTARLVADLRDRFG